MVFDLYILFLVAVVLLWSGATERDRAALTIVLIATVASWLIVTFITRGITSPWKLAIPGALETATILALLRWARNRTGWLQIGAVAVAWVAHLLCFADLHLDTNMVYDQYERILALVAIAQLLACYDTYLHHLSRLGRWWSDLGADRAGVVRGASVPAALLHRARVEDGE